MPGRACHHTRRCALTAPFHPSPVAGLVCFLLHLSSPNNPEAVRRPAVSGLAALWCSDFPLPAYAGSDRPTCSHARRLDYSKRVFNTYSQFKHALAEVFEADSEAVCPGRRQKKRDGYRGESVGKRKCEEVWCFLIDDCPDHPANECEEEQQRIREMNGSKS